MIRAQKKTWALRGRPQSRMAQEPGFGSFWALYSGLFRWFKLFGADVFNFYFLASLDHILQRKIVWGHTWLFDCEESYQLVSEPGAEEKAQWVKGSVGMHEDLSSNLHTKVRLACNAHIYHAVLGAQRQEGPQSWAANQSKPASELQWEILSQKPR